jgi:hypothetical protein
LRATRRAARVCWDWTRLPGTVVAEQELVRVVQRMIEPRRSFRLVASIGEHAAIESKQIPRFL